MSRRHETRLQRVGRIGRGLKLMLAGARRIAADHRSLVQLVADAFAYRLLRVTRLGYNRPRTVRLVGDVTLTYRCNRGDIGTVVETWMTDAYDAPVTVRPGGVILDLGANIGVTGVYLARRHRPETYIAVEPVSPNAALARLNLDANRVPARVIEAAVGPVSGEARFTDAAVSTVGRISPDGRPVRMITVAEALEGLDPSARVDLLKLDIEGGEEALFRGSLSWLDRVDCIVAEIHPDLCEVTHVRTALSAAGFAERRLASGDPQAGEYMAWYVRPNGGDGGPAGGAGLRPGHRAAELPGSADVPGGSEDPRAVGG